ncbi:MAG TPA: hypothetical protein PKK26_13525 [Candidatus Wallbacteria bacterium]|nr:hypothetical protein [Candidatus Wallbacteria bacterium]
MGIADIRRKNQLDFLAGGCEIEIGDPDKLPLAISEFINIDGGSEYVEKHIRSGLTADVYKLKINGGYWNLKKKRGEILVKNIDGQTSFLNEIQRRRDFERLKKVNPHAYSGIVDTAYASLNGGIILSPWIEGGHIKKYTREIFENLFNTLYNIDIAGFFEYDLCPGNLLIQNDGSVRLFDFGYMYPYDPLNEYNADGREIPLFHPAERFESRNFMQYLMDTEEDSGIDLALSEYEMEKNIALKYYHKKFGWLKENNAASDILAWMLNFIKLWETGLSSLDELKKLYDMESFRSYVLDIHDDVSGQSCTRETLKKTERVLSKIGNGYKCLYENRCFFWGDEKLNQAELLGKYTEIKKRIIEYQL